MRQTTTVWGIRAPLAQTLSDPCAIRNTRQLQQALRALIALLQYKLPFRQPGWSCRERDEGAFAMQCAVKKLGNDLAETVSAKQRSQRLINWRSEDSPTDDISAMRRSGAPW